MENGASRGAPFLGRGSVFYGDLQVPEGDGHHLPGVDEDTLAVGILCVEGDVGTCLAQMATPFQWVAILPSVKWSTGGAIFTEGEGSFGRQKRRRSSRGRGAFNRVQTAIQNQFPPEWQPGGIIQGKYEGKGLVRQYPVNGIGHLHLQIGESSGVGGHPGRRCPTLSSRRCIAADFIPLPVRVSTKASQDIRTHEVTVPRLRLQLGKGRLPSWQLPGWSGGERSDMGRGRFP